MYKVKERSRIPELQESEDLERLLEHKKNWR